MTEVHPTTAECQEAIDRIARTSDGRDLYVLLQRRLMFVLQSDSDGALRSDHGERMFASKLIGLMAKGISESGSSSSGQTGSSSTDSGGEQPIVVPASEPRRVGPARNTGGRRVTADSRVPGWDAPE